ILLLFLILFDLIFYYFLLAIVGGGIGGTSASFFLNELFGPRGAHIDLYEPNNIGGRLSVINVEGRDYEVGGSIIHKRNKYMVDFLKLFGLKKKDSRYSRFGLYDGRDFLFTESNWEIINLAKLIWRYGYGPLELDNYINNMLNKFELIYTLQANHKSFATVLELLTAMNPQFVNAMNTSAYSGFQEKGFSQRIIDELITATLTANYGQSTTVHEFVGSVSVAGAGGGLWAVHGGNKRIPQELLKHSKATVLAARVTGITLKPETEDFVVDFVHTKDFSTRNSSVYDIVIVATPLTEDTHADIYFKNFPSSLKFPGKYHRTVCTIVHGKLNFTYFGFENEKDTVDSILTVKLDLIFSAIGRLSPVDYQIDEGQFDIWKIFSQVPLTEEQIHTLFLKHRSVHVVDWMAYPEYYVDQRHDNFILHNNLFHVNAIEWAASAMEMSVIGAKNVALLAHKSWAGVSTDTETTKTFKEEL
ncbi:hypothetical protein ANN_07776, partial [Periplaneta americana]